MLDAPIDKVKTKTDRADFANGAEATPCTARGTANGQSQKFGSLANSQRNEKRPILVILHQAGSNPGHIGQWLRASNYPLDIRRPALGDTLPQTLQQHSGSVIFGGPMSAYDNDPFLADERQLIELALREASPCLGVCLGAQLMAQVLGVEVRRDPLKRAEIGYYRVTPTKAGAEFCDLWPARFYQWHRDGFDLPHGATLLATADGPFPNQAFSYNNTAIGIQFHPEITLAMLNKWTIVAAHRLTLPGAKQRAQHLAGHFQYLPQVARWRACFLEKWISTAQQPK